MTYLQKESIMNKCKGCGTLIDNNDLCERCFRIKHYNDYKVVSKTNSDFIPILENINKTNDFDTDAEYYKASNKVSVDNYLGENTTYYYQYSVDGGTWSDTYTYQTHSFTNFQAILVGDPQIGASGSSGEKTNDDQNIANDTLN